ncbi:hypothetical protein ACTMU2_12285 [Cupriavidus basilensis]
MLADLPDHPAVAAVLAEAADVLQLRTANMDTPSRPRSDGLGGQLCSADRRRGDGSLPGGGRRTRRCGRAGLSIGAYAAAVSAGVLSFADALSLVRQRGNLMEQASLESATA